MSWALRGRGEGARERGSSTYCRQLLKIMHLALTSERERRGELAERRDEARLARGWLLPLHVRLSGPVWSSVQC